MSPSSNRSSPPAHPTLRKATATSSRPCRSSRKRGASTTSSTPTTSPPGPSPGSNCPSIWAGPRMVTGWTSGTAAVGDLRVEVGNGVAVLTLDRPKANNAISGSLLRELLTTVAECDADDRARAIATTANVGDGATGWCAGGEFGVVAGERGP